MRNGEANSAVRILPADGSAPIDTPPLPDPPARRWSAPMLVVLVALGVFVVATRPAPADPDVTTTQPSPIAAIDAELIDLQSPPDFVATNEWSPVPFEWEGSVNDVIRTGASFVAVGYTPQEPMVWISGTGNSWREAGRVEVPEDSRASIDHAVLWKNDIVALGSVADGVGLWAAEYVSNWSYHGRVEVMGSRLIDDLVAGPQLLAVSRTGVGLQGWTSTDGLAWETIGHMTTLDDVYIHGMAANDDWYFAFGGGECAEDVCPGVIYRSDNGTDWEPTAIDSGASGGFVTGMNVANDTLVAVGYDSAELRHTVALWTSTDGMQWTRIAADEPLLRNEHITLGLTEARPGGNPLVGLTINGIPVEGTVGTAIDTDAGEISISRVSDDGVVTFNDSVLLGVGEVIGLNAEPLARGLYVEGPRILIYGEMRWSNDERLVVWTSPDGGVSWSRQIFDSPGGGGTTAVSAGANALVIGESPGGTAFWRATWDTEQIGRAAENLVAGYLTALNARDIPALLGVLPASDDGATPPLFAVPTLGELPQPWWNAESGALDPAAVAATVAYLSETEASIQVEECSSGVALGASDRINVSCDFRVDSALLSSFGIEGETGSAHGLIRSGRLASIELGAAPSTLIWDILSRHTDISVGLNAATAQEHIAIADRVIASILRYGTTRTVETAIGTMEWTWLESTGIDAEYVGSISWSALGFVAIGYDESDAGTPSMTVFTSPDGVEWTAGVPFPDHVEGIWDLQPFAAGVIGQTWSEGEVSLVFFDGAAWTEIPLQPPEGNQYLDLVRVAVARDRALVIAGWWSDEGIILNEAMIIEPDLTVRTADLPPNGSWGDSNIELAGSDAGFLLGSTSYFATNGDLKVWHSGDGQDWVLVTESSSLDDVQYVWNLQEHRSRYFVVGDTAELRCSSQAEERNCVSLMGLWSSPDGAAWDRVITESGEPVSAYEIGSGPLGLVAFGQEMIDTSYPREVYLSIDGITWSALGGLSLLAPDAEWWWIDTPAVGTDTVIAVGSFYRFTGGADSDTSFMITGRLVDG